MNGLELERLLSLIESEPSDRREELLRYVRDNSAEILKQLEEFGKTEIPVGNDKVVLRKAA